MSADPVELPAPLERTPPFERLVRRHHHRLRRVASALLVDRARVDDVLQEAYIKTYRSDPTFADNTRRRGRRARDGRGPAAPHACGRSVARPLRRFGARTRWAIVAVAFALAATAVAGVAVATPTAAANTLDVTVQCPNLTKGGVGVFSVFAEPTGNPPIESGKIKPPPPGFRPIDGMTVETGDSLYTVRLTTSIGREPGSPPGTARGAISPSRTPQPGQ